ncbi:MAG: alpha/beta fold hydrolase [Povalibacter sp.]
MNIPSIEHRYVTVDGILIFYRETGPKDGLPLLLLHGFPSASHQYRRLMDALGLQYRLIAPDYPGFGHSDSPASSNAGGTFVYSFDRLAHFIERFCEQLGLRRFVLYAFDFGGPVGFRIASRHPEWIAGLIVQNANAYAEGLSPLARDFIALRRDQPEAEKQVLGIMTLAFTREQYVGGTERAELVSPDGWTLDQHFLDLPGRKQIQLDLAFDYHTNVALYSEWQRWMKSQQPPTLIVWGANDPFFTADGARAFLRDLPQARVHLLNSGHFALEEKLGVIAPHISDFISTLSAT